jgi:hypothetical protein
MKKSLSVCLFVLGLSVIARPAAACEGSGTDSMSKLKAIVACNSMTTVADEIYVGPLATTITLNPTLATQIKQGIAIKGADPELQRMFNVMVANMTPLIHQIYPGRPNATLRLVTPTGVRLLTIKANGTTF